MRYSDGATEVLHQRYAKALIAIADESGTEDKIFEDISCLTETIDQDERLRKVLFHPEISNEAKLDILLEISKQLKFCNEFLNFLKLLLAKRRIDILHGIFLRFQGLHDQRRQQQRVLAKTAVALSEKQKKALTGALERKFNKKILLEEQQDESVIGGIYIKVGDKIFNTTVESKLNQLRRFAQ